MLFFLVVASICYVFVLLAVNSNDMGGCNLVV
jgi:hypothetical protein